MSHGIRLLGEHVANDIRELWDSMETKRAGSKWEQSEGIIINLIQQNIPENVIRAIVHVGGSRIDRLRKVVKNGIDTLHTCRAPCVPHHAVTEVDMQKIKEDYKDCLLEEGFHCAHRRPQ